MTEFNHQLADQILAQVLMEPQTHSQFSWRNAASCGTTMCVAGWAVELSQGYEHVRGQCNCGCGLEIDKARRPDGSIDEYETVGAELLGLKKEAALALFYTMSNEGAIARLKDCANGVTV